MAGNSPVACQYEGNLAVAGTWESSVHDYSSYSLGRFWFLFSVSVRAVRSSVVTHSSSQWSSGPYLPATNTFCMLPWEYKLIIDVFLIWNTITSRLVCSTSCGFCFYISDCISHDVVLAWRLMENSNAALPVCPFSLFDKSIPRCDLINLGLQNSYFVKFCTSQIRRQSYIDFVEFANISF